MHGFNQTDHLKKKERNGAVLQSNVVRQRPCCSFAVSVLIPKPRNRVLKTPCFMDNRNSAVCLRIHLWKAARFILGWHHEEVATCKHAVFSLWIKAHITTDSSFVVILCVGQLGCIGVFTFAHKNDLHPSQNATRFIRQQPRDDLCNQMNALLVAQTATKTDESSSRIFMQTQGSLQFLLAKQLAFLEVSDAVIHRNVWICFGVPFISNSIEDASHAMLVAFVLKNFM